MTARQAERYDMELMIGPLALRHVPEGEAEGLLRAAWEHRREVLLDRARPGWRPYAWWRFESGDGGPPGLDDEAARLAELGELSDAEVAAVVAEADEALEAQTDGRRAWWGGPPACVKLANGMLEVLDRPLVDEEPFYKWGGRRS